MQDITMQDIFVVAGACVAAWFIGKYIKRKNEREECEEQEQQRLQAELKEQEQRELHTGSEE